jgi:hypothetical protein
MVTFDLQKAKKGIPMRTRNGRTAHLIAHLDGGQPAPVLIEVDGELENYYLNGKLGIIDDPIDLFMEY